MSNTLAKLNRWEEAIDAEKKALKIDRNFTQGHIFLGDLYYTLE